MKALPSECQGRARARKRLGLSLRETAEQLHVSRKTVSKHERRALLKMFPFLTAMYRDALLSLVADDPEKRQRIAEVFDREMSKPLTKQKPAASS